MTVLTETLSEQYPGNDSATEFDFGFTIFDSAELEARLINDATGAAELLVDGDDYNIDVNATGGTVTMTEAPATGYTLDLRPVFEITQPISIKNQGTFRPEVHERAHDRQAAQSQYLRRLLGRTLHLADYGEDDADLVIPADRANKLLGFDVDGNPIMSSGTGADSALRTDLAITTAANDGSRLVGFRLNLAGSVGRSLYSRLAEQVYVTDFGADPTGATSSFAAIQAAHDALPATGGTIRFSGVGARYLTGTHTQYVQITKPNVWILIDKGAEIIAPDSDDIEESGGTSILTGFDIRANDCVIEGDIRGCVQRWFPTAASDRLTFRNGRAYNFYNALVSISSSSGADRLVLENMVLEYSRDLVADTGNYSMINRGADAADDPINLVLLHNVTMRGVSGGVDCHVARHVAITGLSKFEGVDINCVKLATADNMLTEQHVYIEASVVFDGNAVDPTSSNRHLACTGSGRSAPNFSLYGMFLSVFSTVHCHAKFKDFENECVSLTDGTLTNAVLDFQGAVFDNCTSAIDGLQGTVLLRGVQLLNGSNITSYNGATVRSMDITRCRIRNSYIEISKQCVALGNLITVKHNDVDYSVDNLGWIRFIDFGVDSGPTVDIDDNGVTITGGGNTLAGALGTSGTKALWGANNRVTAAAGAVTFSGGLFPRAFQPSATGTSSLYLYNRHSGQIVVVNTAASGNITYNINDASLVCPIGTEFDVIQTHASNLLALVSTGGAINAGTTLTSTTRHKRARLLKTAANTWSADFDGTTWTVS